MLNDYQRRKNILHKYLALISPALISSYSLPIPSLTLFTNTSLVPNFSVYHKPPPNQIPQS